MNKIPIRTNDLNTISNTKANKKLLSLLLKIVYLPYYFPIITKSDRYHLAIASNNLKSMNQMIPFLKKIHVII